MPTLAIDTCFGAVSVAVGDSSRTNAGPTVLAVRRELRETGHAEALFPMIAAVIEDVREATGNPAFAIADVARLAVTRGPGTFTGVRTGIAAVRGLALALSKPVAGVSSLSVVAMGARRTLPEADRQRPLTVVMGAGRGWLYLERFAPGPSLVGDGPRAISESSVLDHIGPEAFVVAGTAAGRVADLARDGGRNVIACLAGLMPDASDLLSCTAAISDDATTLHPLYLRPPDVRPQAGSSLSRAEHDRK
ncbi:MAG: tRNA (adenosine(37)-N6)-threonylcarbamoyltransferase complex dimerization subunit type 1 TsaB [Hyphomicrobiaceae bacterium]